MPALGAVEPSTTREGLMVGALYRYFADDAYDAIPLTTWTITATGAQLSDPLVSRLTMTEALDRLHAFAPDQIVVVWLRFRDRHDTEATARELCRVGEAGNQYVRDVERLALQQLIRWAWEDYDREHGLPLYESPSVRVRFTPRRDMQRFYADLELAGQRLSKKANRRVAAAIRFAYIGVVS
jgi:hypothetical protein